MRSAAACLLSLLFAAMLAGCGLRHPVSSATAGALQGAPGSANDTATGGQGNQGHNDRD